jgi:hypothetical protein
MSPSAFDASVHSFSLRDTSQPFPGAFTHVAHPLEHSDAAGVGPLLEVVYEVFLHHQIFQWFEDQVFKARDTDLTN